MGHNCGQNNQHVTISYAPPFGGGAWDLTEKNLFISIIARHGKKEFKEVAQNNYKKD